MAEVLTKLCVTGLIPLAPAADLQRSIDFYKLLGMKMHGTSEFADRVRE